MTLRLSIVGLGGLVVCGACGLQTAGEFPGDGAPDATVEGTEGDVRFDADDARTDRDDAGPPDDADPPEDGEDGGPVCGNGIVEAPEQCDEGEFNDDRRPDACRRDCREARCGDAVIDTGEECDDGGGNSDTTPDACRTDCRPARCGDGVRDTGEACDDGNTVPDDDCTNACAAPTCGDSIVQPPREECDDGNGVDTDECLSTCMLAACGDRIVHAGVEQCDGDPPQSCGTSCGSIGERSCVGCVWAADCVPPVEICNGQDDDCVSGCDDRWVCCRDRLETRSCGNCGTQSRTCAVSCTWSAWGTCAGGGVCAAGTSESRSCPCGGTETRTCSASCTWAAWSGCATGDCTPGATEMQDCGNCGTQSRTCAVSCTWSAWGTCAGGGVCAAGTSESRSCPCGGTETRTCSASCTWGAWSGCAAGECTPGATQTQSCGNCGTGTQSRTCGASCTWGAWSACAGGGVCAAGTSETRSCPCGGTETRTCSASCTWEAWSGCAAGECTPGATETQNCGNCGTGTQSRTCGASCTWGAWSACAGGGVCAAGTSETRSCPCGGTETRTCSASCTWEAWSGCAAGECTPGATETQSCGNCNTGSQSRTCSSSCFWGPWSACVGGGACSPASTQACNNACGVAGNQTCSAACAWGPCCAPSEVCGNTCDDNCDGATNEGCAPPNDLCAGAIDIGAGGDFTGTTALAGNDNTSCAGGGCGTGDRDVWYRFTLTQPEVVFLTLQDDGQTWDSVLHVRSGSCTGAQAACNDDSCGGSTPLRSQWTGILGAGAYYVVVDGCGSASGPFRLRFVRSPCPEATTARRITAPGTFSDNTCGAANNHSTSSCGGADDPDLPYFLGLCPGTYPLRARTCGDGQAGNWRSSIQIRRGGGGSCGSVEVGCIGANCDYEWPANWRSDITRSVTGPDLFFIIVDGTTPLYYCGDYDMIVSY